MTDCSQSPPCRFYDVSLLPPAPADSWRRWRVRLILWALVAAAFALALRYDVTLMQWRYAVWPEGPKGILKQIFYGFRDFAQVVPIVTALLIIARMDKRRWTIITTVLVAQLLGGLMYNTGKLTVLRYRPQEAVEQVESVDQLDQVHTWAGLACGNREHATQSFPSGHSAGAFALAGVLAWFYPRLGRHLLVLAVGCGVSRYADAVHWPSDVVAGAVIGYLGAWLALRPYVWTIPSRIVRRASGEV